MVVREDREKLIQYLNEYIDGKIKSFEFDEKIGSLYHCGDKTVSDIAFDLWFEYDDIGGHKNRATKEQWDYFQRLLVLLGSGTEIIREKERIWHISQLISLLALIILIYLPCFFDFNYKSLLFYLLILCVANLSHRFRKKKLKKIFPDYKKICYPFADMSQIRAAVRNAEGFRKRKFPKKPKPSGISKILSMDITYLIDEDDVAFFLLGLLLAPIALFSQLFPIIVHETNAQIPEATTRRNA